MTFEITVRVTSKRKCREGFYVLINGQRVPAKTRAIALEQVRGFLALQKIQVCTVREYAERNAKKIAREMPPVKSWVAQNHEALCALVRAGEEKEARP